MIRQIREIFVKFLKIDFDIIIIFFDMRKKEGMKKCQVLTFLSEKINFQLRRIHYRLHWECN